MIRNKLASLLADRGIKISRASMELPNISRNTITNTASNNGKMIQLETIDTLCQYLNITPAEFFEYLPFDLNYHTDITKNEATTDEIFDYINVGAGDIAFDFYIKKTSYDGNPPVLYGFSGSLEKPESTNLGIKLYFKLSNDDKNNFEAIWSNKKVSGFKSQIWQDIKKSISDGINQSMISRFPQMQDDPFNYVDPDGSDILLKANFNVDTNYTDKDDLPF